MSKFGWIVDKDYTSFKGAKSVSVYGPRNMTATPEEIKTLGIHFEMYDDDDILYYSGYVLADGDHNELMPLDHYGMPNAGCTKIKVRDEHGKYRYV